MTYFQVGSGDVVGSNHMNTAINQSVIPFADAAARDAAIPSPTPGMVCYLISTMSLQSFTGSAWVGNPPAGTVIAYGGSTPPGGWHLCDGTAHGSSDLQAVLGTASTPDLRDKFVIAAGASYAATSVGGEVNHTLTIAEMPSHEHSVYQNFGGYWDDLIAIDGTAGAGAANRWHYANGAGTALKAMAQGGSAAHNNMPPYYSLTYIIKM